MFVISKIKNILGDLNFKKLIQSRITIIMLFLLVILILFFPNILNLQLLGQEDGFKYNYPMFEQGFHLWNSSIFLGYPSYSDPQVASFFPIRFIFQILKLDYNLYVMVAYLIGILGTYYLVSLLAKNKLIAILSGLLIGFSLPMLQHLNHINLIYSFVFLPWIIFSIKRILDSKNKLYYLLLCFSTTLSILSGHTQISTYVLIFVLIFIVLTKYIWDYSLKKIFLITLLLCLGIGLSGIQLIPSFNLYSQTPRNSLSLYDFNTYTRETSDVLSVLFPFIYGYPELLQGKIMPLSQTNYFGKWNFTELSGFISAFTIIILFYLSLSKKRIIEKKLITILLIISFVIFLFMQSDLSLLTNIYFKIPILNLFRAHGRMMLFIQFIFVILFSLGLSHLINDFNLKDKTLIRRKTLKSILFTSLVYMSTLIVIYLFRFDIVKEAAERNISLESLSPLKNISVLLPLLFFVLSSTIIIVISYLKITKYFLSLLLIVLIVIEVFPIAYNMDWKYNSPKITSDYCNKERFSENINLQKKRILIWDGVFSHEIPPNINMLCGIYTLNGYNPLVLKKFILNTGSNGIGMIENSSILLSSNQYLLNQLGIEEIVVNIENQDVVNLLKENGLKIKSIGKSDIILSNLYSKEIIYSPKHISYSPLDFLTILSGNVLDNETVYVNKDPNLTDNNLKIDRIENSISDKINISVEPMNQTGYIYTSMVNYPGWRLRFQDSHGKVINNNGEIIEANGGFISFIVPPNTKSIKLYFEPFDLKLGLAISVISLLILILVTFVDIPMYSYKVVDVIKRKRINSKNLNT